jgi:L-rhamnose isomerase
MQEIVRAKALDRVYIGTDYFDGSINRVGALALGARTIYKALLYALLEPTERIKGFEDDNDLFSRLAFLEDLKTAPAGAVWEKFCEKSGVPGDFNWAEAASDYEIKVLSSR